MIDPHVHCRDDDWKHKDTIEHCLRVAEDSGLSAIFDEPNTEPPVTTMERAVHRLKLAEQCNSKVFYGAYIGITSNPEQIREAVETYRELFPKSGARTGVIGFKMFAGKSVGDLSVVNEEEQQEVYNQLAKLGYLGVLALHCEKESLMRSELWNPSSPITHCYARPKQAETESITDQIEFAGKAGFKGKLHIHHVSVPESVDIISGCKRHLSISCGVTANHLILNDTIMYGQDGIMYKVNPPLRSQESMHGLFDCLLDGRIDIMESDHANHTPEEKTGIARDKKGNPMYMSGIPSVASWPDTINILSGLGVREGLIKRMTWSRVIEIFDLQKLGLQKNNSPLVSHVKDYAFDPYKHFK